MLSKYVSLKYASSPVIFIYKSAFDPTLTSVPIPNPAARNGHEAPIAPPAPASPSIAYPIAPGIVDAPTTVFAVLTAPVKVFPSPVFANTVEGTFKAGDGPN